MDINGLLDLREGSFYLIIVSIVPLLLLVLYTIGGIAGSTIGFIILIIIGIITLILVAFGLSDYWDGFNKLKGGFKQANIGKIGSLLSIFGITFILGIAFYFLGKSIKNNKVKIGGIFYIILLPLLGLSSNIFPLFLEFLYDILLPLGPILLYLGLTEAAKKIGLLK